VSLPERAEPSGVERGTATAGAGGIGGGTLLVVIANWLPSDHWARDLLIWAAPAASVTLTGIWLWVQRRVPELYKERKQQKVIAKAKHTLTQGIENPHTSDAHRANLRSELEAIEVLEAQAHVERVRLVIETSEVQRTQS
jgi:hypothetical protein